MRVQSAESKKQDITIIRLLSEDFKQLADRSQDAIYQFDIESQTFPFFNKQFLSQYAMEENGVKILSPKSVLLILGVEQGDDVFQSDAIQEVVFQPLMVASV